jgi:hypothetical protein
VPTLEEIVFPAGRDALADQDSIVTGIRQRTGTLLAAHALVASFLARHDGQGQGSSRLQLGVALRQNPALMAPRPVSPDQIKTPSIQIGIQEGCGGSTPPAPRPSGK